MANPRVLSIHYQAPVDEPRVAECVIIEIIGGPKRYARVWPASLGVGIEWGWTLNEFTEQVWEDSNG